MIISLISIVTFLKGARQAIGASQSAACVFYAGYQRCAPSPLVDTGQTTIVALL